MKLRTLIATSTASALILCAISVSARTQVPGDRTVTEIRQYTTNAIVYFSPSFADGEGCVNSGSGAAVVDWGTESERKSMLAAAYTAMATNANVGFGLEGCSGFFPSIYRFEVKQQ